MRTFDALWQAYQAETSPTWLYDVKVLIAGEEYLGPEIYGDWTKSGGLISDDFSLGNCVIQQFSISVKMKSGVSIPKNAKVEPYIRMTGTSGNTLWHRVGVYFVESRTKPVAGKITLSCLDRMAYADVPFLSDGEALEDYPMPMDDAMARVYTKLGTTLDPRCTISHTLMMEYPNDMTMRQVAGMIASAHGGNFVITDDDLLRLVKPGYATAVAAVTGSTAKKLFAGNDPITYDSVAMIYTEDGSYLTSGTGDNELQITNYWATQAICDGVQAALNGYTYTPYTAEGAILDPAVELGDHITLNGINANLWCWSWTNRMRCTVTIPSSSDTKTSEFGYTGTLTQAISKKVTLNAPYNGTIISRANGILTETSDKLAKIQVSATATGIMISLRDSTSESYTETFFIRKNPSTNKMELYLGGNAVFAGKLSADVIEALSAVITPSLYAKKANISDLTVDRLDTSDKVQKYLATDATDDNFQRIYDQFHEWVTAHTDGLDENKVQATNRAGELLYWVDGTHEAATTTDTGLPVYLYQYTETNKLWIGFRLDPGGSGFYRPMIGVGAGTGVGDNGKAFIYMGLDGLHICRYSAVDGSLREIILTDAGIILTPYALESVDFYSNGFSTVYSGESIAFTWTKDESGRITSLITEDMVTIPITRHAEDM